MRSFLAIVTIAVLIGMYFLNKKTDVTSQNNIIFKALDTEVTVLIAEKEFQKEYSKEWIIKTLRGCIHFLDLSNGIKNSLLNAIWVQYSDYP